MRSLLKLQRQSKLLLPTQHMRMFNSMDGKIDLSAATQDFNSELTHWETLDRTSLQFTLSEAPGVLNKAINILTANKVNMTRI